MRLRHEILRIFQPSGNNILFFRNPFLTRALGVTPTVQTKPRSYGKEIILIGILALTLITAFIVIPKLQSNANQQSQQNQQGQPITVWGYVLIGSKGTPNQVFFDNPTTGRYSASAYTSDKSYSINLLTGYSYTVTIQYIGSGYNYVNCAAQPPGITPTGSSGSSIRQDFSC